MKVTVLVRVRPMVAREVKKGAWEAATVLSDSQLTLAGTRTDEKNKTYNFDRIFGASTSQSEFFDCSNVKEMINCAINGYSCTIFAYGTLDGN